MSATEYFDSTGAPANNSQGSSSVMRAEFDRVQDGFGKLPDLSGNANKAVTINAGASGMTVTTGTLALAGNFATVGANALTLTTTGATSLTLPTSGTIVTTAGPTFTGTVTIPTLNVTGAFSAVTGMNLIGDNNGSPLRAIIQNNNAAAGSDAGLDISSSGGDARIHFYTAGGADWKVGVDRSDSSNFVFSRSLTLGSSNKLAITTGGIKVTGTISATGNIGYATGAGGTVTQSTNKSTAVTLDKSTGDITMDGAALAAGAIVSFTLNNSQIAAADQLLCTHHETGTFGAYTVNGRATGSGTAVITVRNNSTGSLSEAIVIKFSVLNSVTS